MEVRANSKGVSGSQVSGAPPDSRGKQAVLNELASILTSQAFRTSERSKQFLSYVVQRTLEGRTDTLKERLIGAELFQRPATYATGEDPVVRNKASEVRRRLIQYYYEESHSSPVRIELPVGSYVPEFQWSSDPATIKHASLQPPVPGRKRWLAAVAGLSLALLGLTAAVVHYAKPTEPAVEKFWAPALNTTRPVLICLAKPVLYRPSLALFRRYARTHPGTFQTEVERNNTVLPLDPEEPVTWGDMVRFPDFGVGMGDVYAATRLCAMLGRMNKSIEVRIGNDYSYEDLRSSPAVVIGAFSNRWTLQMTSNLRFIFADDRQGSFWIQEQGGQGRAWRYGSSGGQSTEDFGIVTRLVDSKTGQLLIAAAGITGAGCQAAGELISRQDYLAAALSGASPDWPKKNLQVVFQTNVIDCVAGPPRVVATYFW